MPDHNNDHDNDDHDDDHNNDHNDDVWTDLVEHHADHARAHPATGDYPEHHPRAAVLACSDARVPPSVVFGQGAGALFVVRIAGNSATPTAIASLTFAVEHLGTELVIVLGHTGCGAVGASLAKTTDAALQPILDPIDEMLAEWGDDLDPDAAVAANVRYNCVRLEHDRGPLGRAIAAGTVTVRGAVHDLRTGALLDAVDLTPLSSDPTTT